MEYMLRLNGAKWFNDDFTQAVGVTSEEANRFLKDQSAAYRVRRSA
jgi:hypothetical protein